MTKAEREVIRAAKAWSSPWNGDEKDWEQRCWRLLQACMKLNAQKKAKRKR